jgi:hypothetical protein
MICLKLVVYSPLKFTHNVIASMDIMIQLSSMLKCKAVQLQIYGQQTSLGIAIG